MSEGYMVHGSVPEEMATDMLTAVYTYVRRRCPNPDTAEDITQEALLAVMTGLAIGQDVRDPVAYAIGVARHKLIDQIRREVRDRRLFAKEQAAGPWRVDSDVSISSERYAPVDIAFASMTDEEKALLLLKYVDGVSTRKLASLVGKTRVATESALARARRKLRLLVVEGSRHEQSDQTRARRTVR